METVPIAHIPGAGYAWPAQKTEGRSPTLRELAQARKAKPDFGTNPAMRRFKSKRKRAR